MIKNKAIIYNKQGVFRQTIRIEKIEITIKKTIQ